jgi:hypothetical protein
MRWQFSLKIGHPRVKCFQHTSGEQRNMWEIRINHPGLSAYRVVKGKTQSDAELKAASQIAMWDERWERRLNAERLRRARSKVLNRREASKAQVEAAKASAVEQTRELEQERGSLENTLMQALSRDPRVNWELKKDRTHFSTKRPATPALGPIPREPTVTDTEFAWSVPVPTVSLLDRLISSRRLQKESAYADQVASLQHNANRQFADALDKWRIAVIETQMNNAKLLDKHKNDLSEWEEAKKEFVSKQRAQHHTVDEDRARY